MITWHIKQFDDLTTKELYAILALRNQVFIVEQKILFKILILWTYMLGMYGEKKRELS